MKNNELGSTEAAREAPKTKDSENSIWLKNPPNVNDQHVSIDGRQEADASRSHVTIS